MRPGGILGTAPYISPEHARGQATDHRADICAFGCVLYEDVAQAAGLTPVYLGTVMLSTIVAAVGLIRGDIARAIAAGVAAAFALSLAIGVVLRVLGLAF